METYRKHRHWDYDGRTKGFAIAPWLPDFKNDPAKFFFFIYRQAFARARRARARGAAPGPFTTHTSDWPAFEFTVINPATVVTPPDAAL
jgi:hypothetical protein